MPNRVLCETAFKDLSRLSGKEMLKSNIQVIGAFPTYRQSAIYNYHINNCLDTYLKKIGFILNYLLRGIEGTDLQATRLFPIKEQSVIPISLTRKL